MKISSMSSPAFGAPQCGQNTWAPTRGGLNMRRAARSLMSASRAPRLLDVLVLNRPVAASGLTDRSSSASDCVSARFQVLFVGYLLFSHVTSGGKAYQKAYVTPQRPPL